MISFCFQLSDQVAIKASGECGHIVGRAEYVNSSNNYLVRYRRADGTAVEAWWTEDALQAA